MPIQIAVLKETRPNERRVAMVPSVAKQLAALGATVHMQRGAGEAIRLPDRAFTGVEWGDDPNALAAGADILLAVQPPPPAIVQSMRQGAILISYIHAHQEPELTALLRDRGITCFAMELVPRISRAQAMDALSSQAALAGYYAALLAATHMSRIVPRMTTAAGVIRPANALVMGLGVAGLQAIATLRRLGAVIEGYDVRPETREEALSLGAKFVDTGVDARGEGGYARPLTPEERAKVDAVMTQHIQQSDIVITAASVPGRRAPRLISRAQVEGMKAGAVIVDLGAEGGGNCEAGRPGETTQVGEVTVLAPLNVPSLLGEHASELYARNLLNLLKLMIVDKQVRLDWSDEVVAQTALTHAGEIKNAAARQALEGVAARI